MENCTSDGRFRRREPPCFGRGSAALPLNAEGAAADSAKDGAIWCMVRIRGHIHAQGWLECRNSRCSSQVSGRRRPPRLPGGLMVSKILAGRLAALAAPKGKVSIAATFCVRPRSIQRTRATTRVLASMRFSLVGGSNRWSATNDVTTSFSAGSRLYIPRGMRHQPATRMHSRQVALGFGQSESGAPERHFPPRGVSLMVEYLVREEGGAGSNPATPTKN
jgi:hypothetical protein